MKTILVAVANVLLAGAVSASDAAPPYGWNKAVQSMAIAPLSGIEHVTTRDPGHVEIFSTRGICKFRIKLAAKQTATISLLYSSLRSFEKIEGVDVTDNAAQEPLSLEDLLSSGMVHREGGTIRIAPQGSALDWTVQVIDYYR